MDVAAQVVTKGRRVAADMRGAARDMRFSLLFAQTGQQLLAPSARPGTTPADLFHTVSDDFWLWLNTTGYRKHPALQHILPSMPSVETQLRFTGATGDATMREAFAMYTLCKRVARQYAGGVAEVGSILDYGCGWGRIIRLFLKDVQPSNLMGVDCLSGVLDIARQTNSWCEFKQIPTMPPTELPDGAFGLVYLFSVFSHLSEEAQARWLVEFKRILRPGGLLVATTRPREFILHCVELSRLQRMQQLPDHLVGAAGSFLDSEEALAAYDRGEFVHSPSGGGDILDNSFYGESAVPRAYVEQHWTQHFTILDFVDDRRKLPQNAIVARKN